MTQPLIGITTYGRDEENKVSLPAEYSDAVRRAGGIPLLIPPGEQRWEDLLPHLDGLILAGGGDLDPELYAGYRHESIYMLDPERDSSELALAKKVIATGLPTLAICRGIQVINVALGGTLIEHLPDEVGEKVAHREVRQMAVHGPPQRKPIRHSVEIVPGSRLAMIVGKLHIDSCSWHHQALRTVAPQLTVTAYAADGTVEAAELADHPWMIAVQWHPELTAADDPIQQRLFDALVEASRNGDE
jgi:putative glutamine amidotransferase